MKRIHSVYSIRHLMHVRNAIINCLFWYKLEPIFLSSEYEKYYAFDTRKSSYIVFVIVYAHSIYLCVDFKVPIFQRVEFIHISVRNSKNVR